MYGIAHRHGVSVADLMAANSTKSDAMREGQQLVIPGAANPSGNGAAMPENALTTRIFHAPAQFPSPSFLTGQESGVAADPFAGAPDPFASPPAADPFAAPPPQTPAALAGAMKRQLEAAGVSFPEGAGVQISNGKIIINATSAELDKIEAYLEQLRSAASGQILLRVEIFSATPAQYAVTLAQNPTGGGLYQWCDAALEKPESKVALEQFTLLRMRSGQRSKVEQIDEYPYPTEFNPPQIAQSFGSTNAVPVPVKDASTPAPAPAGTGISHPPAYPLGMYVRDPRTQATPTAFQMRNLGFTLEAEVNVSDDGAIADINLAPEFSKVVRVIPWQVDGEIYQPVFQTRKAAFQTLCEMGKTRFAGTMSTPPDTGVAGADKEDRIWLVFLTPSVAR